MERHGIGQQFAAHERIMVCVTPRANVSEMMGVARTVADRFHADLIAAYVHQPELSQTDQAALDEKLAIAREAGARVEILDGEDPIDLLLEFAKSHGVTQLFIGHSQRRGAWSRMWGTPVDRLIRQSRGMDIRVFPH
jgi:two-component system sensor histidine kinase KdpD